jgi:hypothetical protein
VASEPQNVASTRDRLLCYVFRTTVAAILAWLLLCVWDILADPDPPNLYTASGLMHVAQAKALPSDSADKIAAKGAILQSHLASLRNADLLEKAKERVRISYPELTIVMPRLRVFTTASTFLPEIKISGVSSEPFYLQALVNELISEHIANKKREMDESAEGRAYGVVIQRVLESQRDVATFRKRLEEIEGTGLDPDPVRTSLRKQLTEAEARYSTAKEALTQFPPDCSETFGIVQLAKSEPYVHELDPYSLIVYHPWRALASIILAWILVVLLIPLRRTVAPEAPLPRPTEA